MSFTLEPPPDLPDAPDYGLRRTGPVPGPEWEGWPGWYRPSKYRATANKHVMDGRHPFGLGLAKNGEVCGTCRFATRKHMHGKTYRKCEQHGDTRGPATDLVLTWEACRLWEAK